MKKQKNLQTAVGVLLLIVLGMWWYIYQAGLKQEPITIIETPTIAYNAIEKLDLLNYLAGKYKSEGCSRDSINITRVSYADVNGDKIEEVAVNYSTCKGVMMSETYGITSSNTFKKIK